MKIAIGSDHAGFPTKAALADHLRKSGYEVEDYGTLTDQPCDYPPFAEKVARAVVDKKSDFGILVCSTGIGMSIAANKVPGVRASLVMTERMATDTKIHNNSNVLVLAGRELPIETNLGLADVWLKSTFSNVERHARRVQEIVDIEKKYLKGS